MKHFSKIVLCSLLALAAVTTGCTKSGTVKNGNNNGGGSGGNVKTTHPMLFINDGDAARLLVNIKADSYLSAMHDNLIAGADVILTKDPLPRTTDTSSDFRILKTSREILRRVFFLSYSYQMTGESKYADRAIREMLNASAFSDWNASVHFLDCAELCMAMAVGYDWLYNYMTAEQRLTVRNAIITKALQPSDISSNNSSFIAKTTNWNQVCNCGLAAGALVLTDYDKNMADKYISRSIESIKLPMAMYAPDGAYAEGPDYWEYGTMYNVMFIDMLSLALGGDSGLSQADGFLSTGVYSQQVVTSLLSVYNYYDNSTTTSVSTPCMWFYKRTKNNALLYMQRRILDTGSKTYVNNVRYLPLYLIWAAQAGAKLSTSQAPADNFYLAGGITPVCTMRSGWEKNSLFVGTKGGRANTSHAHMDQGSFVFEADGERWSIDLGAETYANIEPNVSSFWNPAQTSGRWNVFRYNNMAHSTLTFSSNASTFTPVKQNVAGAAAFTAHVSSEALKSATLNLTPCYRGIAANSPEEVYRAVALVANSYAMTEDKVTGGTSPTIMDWRMVVAATAPQIQLNSPEANMVTVTKANGAKLYIKFAGADNLTLLTLSTTPSQSYENGNPGTAIIVCRRPLAAGEQISLKAYLMPSTVKDNLLSTLF